MKPDLGMNTFCAAYLLSSVLAFTTLLAGQKRSTKPECSPNLPQSVQIALERSSGVEVSCRIIPPFIQGDFDGDGSSDFAVLVVSKSAHQRGFLLVFGKGDAVVIGAGHPAQYGAGKSLDLNFDQWELYPKTRAVEAGVGENKPLKLTPC